MARYALEEMNRNDAPSEEMKTVYVQIAKMELERIDAEDEDDEDLICGHSVDEHRQALDPVVLQLLSHSL